MGFGVDYNNNLQWAMFSTNNTTDSLFARTNTDPNSLASETLTQIPGNWIGTPHRYRIVWNAASVDYYIDGALVASHAVSPAGNLRPLASDFNVGGANLSIDWAHMSPYASTGTFLSRIFDGGTTVNWNTLTWTSTLTTGTNLVMSVRTGDTPTPDASWSQFTQVSTSGGAIGQSGRYIQYRAELSTTDPAVTPVLERVEIGYSVNQAPVLAAIGNKTVDELAELTFTATATDPDVPAQQLTFSLVGAPAGASIDPASGVFTWTPTEAQGPGTYPFTVRVCDNGNPVQCAEEQITVTVNEVNAAPVLGAIGNQTVNAGSQLSFTATATDTDIPAQQLTFSLANGTNGQIPAGASIDPTTGVFTWTPTGAQVGTHTFDVCVSDGALSDCETITVTVNGVNAAPVLAPIGNKTVDELTELTFTATATDPDMPAQQLTFSLENGASGQVPAGASIDPATGVFTWTPTEAQGPGTYTFDVCVSDGTLSDCETITVTVNEVNTAPVLGTIGNQTVNAGSPLSFTATATDADIPANTLAFSLENAPAGAAINPASGAFTWTPTEAQVGTHTFTVKVCDNGNPVMCDAEQITVTVRTAQESNPSVQIWLPMIIQRTS